MKEKTADEMFEELKNKQYTNKDILGNLVLSEEEYTAISNLISENKELKEMLKHRIEYTDKLEKDLFQNASNYVIPKSKIEEKIEELKDNMLSSENYNEFCKKQYAYTVLRHLIYEEE